MREYMGFKQGLFKCKNPQKYKGNPTQIVYRSSWEFRYMMQLDHASDVVQWSSEEMTIPYRSPVDGKVHRYFPDFIVQRKDKDGNIKVFMIEIKPKRQTKPPVKPARMTKKFLAEVNTYGVNSAKWSAAEAYCAYKGWTFLILTEKELF